MTDPRPLTPGWYFARWDLWFALQSFSQVCRAPTNCFDGRFAVVENFSGMSLRNFDLPGKHAPIQFSGVELRNFSTYVVVLVNSANHRMKVFGALQRKVVAKSTNGSQRVRHIDMTKRSAAKPCHAVEFDLVVSRFQRRQYYVFHKFMHSAQRNEGLKTGIKLHAALKHALCLPISFAFFALFSINPHWNEGCGGDCGDRKNGLCPAGGFIGPKRASVDDRKRFPQKRAGNENDGEAEKYVIAVPHLQIPPEAMATGILTHFAGAIKAGRAVVA